MTSAGRASSPPVMRTRRWERVPVSNVLTTMGVNIATDTLFSTIKEGSTDSSSLPGMTTVAPLCRARNISKRDTSKEGVDSWAIRSVSTIPIACALDAIMLQKPRCVLKMPFGIPVVPEVYMP